MFLNSSILRICLRYLQRPFAYDLGPLKIKIKYGAMRYITKKNTLRQIQFVTLIKEYCKLLAVN